MDTLIYNIDRKGINTEYTPPNVHVVAGRGYQPQKVMAEKSKTDMHTIIGAGNALSMRNQNPLFRLTLQKNDDRVVKQDMFWN